MAIDDLEGGARRGAERFAQLLGETPPGEPTRAIGARASISAFAAVWLPCWNAIAVASS